MDTHADRSASQPETNDLSDHQQQHYASVTELADTQPQTHPAPQIPTDEFIQHSVRIRSNHRPLLSVPNADDNPLFEDVRGWGFSRKRKYQGLRGKRDSHTSLGRQATEAQDNNEPTTAELAEAAARESNKHHSLPAFYSPDQLSLNIRTVIIPVDTNPMERRKIIVDFSKDISIRWRDSDQKKMYECSKDGLVGEEIGEIEFDYLHLPMKPLRKPYLTLHCHHQNNETGRITPSAPHHQQPPGPPVLESTRLLREMSDSLNESGHYPVSRTLPVHLDHQRRPYDSHHQYRHTGLQTIAARMRNSNIVSSNDHPPPSNRESRPDSTQPTGPLTGPIDRAQNSGESDIGRPPRYPRSSSGGRLTRRPIRWFERPVRDFNSTPSRPSISDPALAEPQPPPAPSSSLRIHSISRDLWVDDLDAFYQQLNPHHPLDQFLYSSMQRADP